MQNSESGAPSPQSFLTSSVSRRAPWGDQIMADDMLEKRKQQKELNCSLCRRVWRYGKKREVPEERQAEKKEGD